MIEANGVAHVILTVSQWEKARAFYAELLPFRGMTEVYGGDNFLYHLGGRSAIGIRRCAPEHVNERFVQNRVGCTIFASAPGRARMSTRRRTRCARSAAISIADPGRATPHPVITSLYSRIPMASGWR
jgi:catechol 2,3-dioxygenase-like lactoylglutathione lyase family enzyme